MVYYFAGYFQATASNDQKVSFTVPSGNFGNICAGHVARMMGLPIDTLVLATNENDVLDEFFRTGVYRVRVSADTHETSSPSMDISKASNFERFVFDLLGRDARQGAGSCSASELASAGPLRPERRPGLRAGCAALRLRQRQEHPCRPRWPPSATPTSASASLIDTHTADGLKVAREHLQPGVPMIVLETALPIKFAATIVEALGHEPDRPARFEGIEQLPKRVTVLPADVRGGQGVHRAALRLIGGAHESHRLAGFSGSGKTTLVERLIPALKLRGLRVSVVKHAHHKFDIDHPGKDTYRHREAGAFEVVVASDQRLALMREFEQPAQLTVHHLIAELYEGVDWVLVEGFKDSDLLKIEVWRAASRQAGAVPE